MFALKLVLVPGFVLLITLAGRRWGPSVAGWLAGLPVVAGPILFFIAHEQGNAFAAQAAVSSLAVVLGAGAYSVVYAWVAQRRRWPFALGSGLAAWATMALGLSHLPPSLPLAIGIALVTLVAVQRLFPVVRAQASVGALNRAELACRMGAGALLTVVVTFAASSLGQAWSGLLSVFPVMGIVLSVFSHRSQSAAFAALLLKGMMAGMWSFAGFCMALSLALPRVGLGEAFGLSVLVALAIQMTTRLTSRWIDKLRGSVPPGAAREQETNP